MHEDEGTARGFPLILANIMARAHGNHDVGADLLCEKQTLEYDFIAVAGKAEATRYELESRIIEAVSEKA